MTDFKSKTYSEFVSEKNNITEDNITEENVLLYEKLSKEARKKLKRSDFVFPEERGWPIQDEKQAKIALIFASWPKNKDKKAVVVKAVLKKYPALKEFGAAKK